MGWRAFNRNDPSDIKLLEDICKDSGSKSVSRERAYIRRVIFNTSSKPETMWCEVLDECAFYLSTKGKGSIRNVFTVVRSGSQGKGYGRRLVERQLMRMQQSGIAVFALRTSTTEDAHRFWQRMGGGIVGLNGNDFEMEIKIKI